MSLHFQVSTGSTVPIYRQIVDEVRRGVARGELSVGQRLPSVRELAAQLLVNHNTVAKAFAELTRDGTIESHQGRGVFVAKRRNVYTKAERNRKLGAALEAFLSEALALDFDDDEIRQAVSQKLERINEQRNQLARANH